MRNAAAAALHTLPPPPPGRTGWPWTVETPPLPQTQDDGRAWPKVTVVTPSFNQARFLEETIRSVLLQGYPHLEYIVLDGGSRDESAEVIRRYERWLSYWTSEKDAGQSDAINKGFRRATGEWVGWQNSDDFYAPGALAHLARTASAQPTASVIYGSVQLCDADSKVTGSYPTSAFDPHAMLPWANMFNQSMFFHRRVFEGGHLLDESQHHFIDHDFFWRLILAGYAFQYCPDLSAVFRIHDLAKGATQHEVAARELYALYKRLHGECRLPASVRRKALVCLRNHCVDQFGKSRWPLFDQFTADLQRSVGVTGLGLNLNLRRLARVLGTGNIARVRRLKHLVIKPNEA
jgi:glycosyltransferase involved in cell wall biosynthesis